MDNKSSNGSLRNGAAHQNGQTYEEVEAIAASILERVSSQPKVGIVCGSGLGGLAAMVTDKAEIPYEEIEGFPVSTEVGLDGRLPDDFEVPGHAGKLVFGQLKGKPVVLMQGRAHLYEGYDVHKIVLPIRVMKLMGVRTLFVTNAAGGINESFNVGDIMILKDHFNMPGFAAVSPLVGPNDTRFGPRFPPATQSYDLDLRKLAKKIGNDLGMDSFLREGVYCYLGGPSFETVTECRFLKLAGVDATGMSTVPEVLVARHCGMNVFGMSLITNKCIMDYDSMNFANHEEVLETGKRRASDMQLLLSAVVEQMSI